MVGWRGLWWGGEICGGVEMFVKWRGLWWGGEVCGGVERFVVKAYVRVEREGLWDTQRVYGVGG